MQRALLIIIAVLLVGRPQPAAAVLQILGQFDPASAGGLCGGAFDPLSQRVWVHACSGADVQSYSTGGTFVSSVARPGESANDVDVEVASEAVSFGGAPLPAGTLFFINGESGPAEIYAMNAATGAVIDTLPTDFGVSHVVGGAYHSGRSSFFLIQDRVPAADQRNRVAEIDPLTGQVLNTFQIGADFDVNFGDLDVCGASGNLLVVSSIETSIGEFTPTGQFVQEHPLPAGVSSLSGIGQDDASGETWVYGTGGAVWRLGGLPCGNVGVSPAEIVGPVLEPAAPNPATGLVSIRYTLPERAHVSVRVYDAAGRFVRALFEGTQPAGEHGLLWDGRDGRGRSMASGVYWYEMASGDGPAQRRSVVLLR